MDKSFVNIMNGFISFAGALEPQYGVKSMQTGTQGNVEDMMPSNYLVTCPR